MKYSEEKIKPLIEKLKHNKDTLQFEINNLLIIFGTIVIGVAAMAVSVIIALNTILIKGLAFSLFLLLLAVVGYMFKNPIMSRTDKLKEINQNIEENYNKLLQ